MPDGFWGIFFDSWAGLLRVLIIGTLAYTALVLILRVSGKRTLSKMNAFDLVVTVALGSTLATIILSQDVALLEGVVAFALLVCLQYVISRLSVRSMAFSHLVKSDPTLLFYRGDFVRARMRSERLVESEVLAAIRAQGVADPGDVEAVVLESDGSLSVIRRSQGPSGVLDNVAGFGEVTKPERDQHWNTGA